MHDDALYLVALHRIADRLYQAEQARLVRAVRVRRYSAARWRAVIGHGLIALGQWVENARPLPGEIGEMHWQSR